MMSVHNPHLILLSLAVLVAAVAVLVHAVRMFNQPQHAHDWHIAWPFDRCNGCGDIRPSNKRPTDETEVVKNG